MSAGALIRSTWLLYFSQPANDRALYKAVKGRTIRSIVELGVGDGKRTTTLFEVLAWKEGNLPLRYTGIDLFEARPAGSNGLTLKQAFSAVRAEGVKVQLVPGTPHEALARCANQLAGTDLLLISADQQASDLERAWRFVPRTIHKDTLILREQAAGAGKTVFQPLTFLEVERLARESNKSQRRAA